MKATRTVAASVGVPVLLWLSAGVATGRDLLMSEVKEFLDEDGWNYTDVTTGTAVTIPFKGNAGTWLCYAETKEEAEQVVFYSILPYSVPENKRLAVAEYITRANYGLVIGNFEMDMDEGELSYKTSIDVEGGDLEQTMVKNLIYLNVLMMDRYLPGINKVVYGDVAPKVALQEIQEQLTHSEGSE